MRKHKVSVIIPIYNVEKVLSRCINSVINQTYKDIEIILVNDGSKDSCKEICEEYVGRDNRCRLIDIQNAGVGNARNKGLEVATGDYIVFIDADDIIDENYVEILLKCAEENSLQIVSCAFNVMKEHEVVEKWAYVEPVLHVVDAKTEYNFSDYYAKRNVCGVIIKSTLLESQRFDCDLYVGEDMYLFSKLLVQCDKVGYIDSALYGYVLYSQSATNGEVDKKKLSVLMAYERMQAVLEPFPTLLSGCNAVFALQCAQYMRWINYYNSDKKELDYDKLRFISKKYFMDVMFCKRDLKSKILYAWQILFPSLFYALFRLKQKTKNNI